MSASRPSRSRRARIPAAPTTDANGRPKPSTARKALAATMGARLPTTDGTIHSAHLHRPATIRRDRHGVPHIDAADDHDAWYAIGFCQGQDRAFQLETRLRFCRGTLSELIGRDGLPFDRLSRRIGFDRAAHRQLDALDPEHRSQVEAFAQGITDGARLGLPKRPHELAILRRDPSAYSAADAIAALGLVSFMLASNWDSELTRLKILLEDGPDAVSALDPIYPEWLTVSDQSLEWLEHATDRLTGELSAFIAATGFDAGSNNWAVAGSRTRSGRPIVANDPHLSPMLPPHWYLCHVRTPEWAAAGATLVGAPGFALGHNGAVAWGVTAGQIDNTDLFIEELSADGTQVRRAEGWAPVTVRYEHVRVRFGADETVKVIETSHGPLLTDELDGIDPQIGDTKVAFALKATWLQPARTAGILTVHRSASAAELPTHFERWPALSLNFAFADTTGTIGWKLVGDAPRRRRGHGVLPTPGWVPDAGWEDEPWPGSSLPGLVDPPSGFVATANNRAGQDGVGPFLTHDWLDGFRVDRIAEQLEARTDWDLDATLRLHLDRVSLVWRELEKAVLGADATTEPARWALTQLDGWNGELASDSAPATIFQLLLAELGHRVTAAKAPNTAAWAMGRSAVAALEVASVGSRRMQHLVDVVARQPDGWFAAPWPVVIGDALDTVVTQLRADHGPDPAAWGWGHLRPLVLEHPFALVGGPVAAVFNLGPYPWGGDAHTICNGAVNLNEPLQNPYGIPSLRMAIEVGNWDDARFSLPGGNSGNPCSPHYDDMVPAFLAGHGIPMAWSESAVDAATTTTLRLEPAP